MIKNGTFLVLAAAILWGTTGTAQAFAPEGAPPTVIGAMRLAIGGTALLVFAASRGVLFLEKRWPFLPTISAAGSMAAYQVFFFAAVATTGVAIGTVVTIGSAPIIASVLGYIFRGDRPNSRWGIATLLAISGCSLLITASGSVYVNVGGVLMALGAGFFYASSIVASKILLQDRPPDAAMAVVFSLGAIFLSPLLITGELSWLEKPNGVIVALHLGLIATAMAYVLYARGLTILPLADAVTLSLAEPLTATALGVFLLGEKLNTTAIIGIGLLFSGLALLTVGQSRRRFFLLK